MCVLLYAKRLKETETEETIVFFVTFLSLVAFQVGGGPGLLGLPLATPMTVSTALLWKKILQVMRYCSKQANSSTDNN